MLLKLVLKNFKNLSTSYDLSDKINIIFANNGSGKTNTLESIFILSNGYSFNSYPEINMINFSKREEFSKIFAQLEEDELEVIITNQQGKITKKLKVNGAEKSAQNFAKYFDAIFFSPNTVDLVAGTPSTRRKDLDDFLSKIDYKYRQNLNTYKSVLQNRNKLLYKLRQGNGSLEELDFWNDKMVQTGSYIIEERIKLLAEVEKEIIILGEKLFNEKFENFKLEYISKISSENVLESFQKIVQENIDDEILSAASLYGPHRDDLLFKLMDYDLKYSGSRGQQRLAALIYKIALWNKIKILNNRKPVLLLDDIMSELDSVHRVKIENLIKDDYFGQVFITSCDREDFSEEFIGVSNQISIDL